MTAYVIGYVLFVVVWFIFLIKSSRRKHETKEIVVNGGILGISLLIGSLLLAHVKVPSFIVVCIRLLEPVGIRLLGQ
ncbi:hypothetical protein [Paenibacillus glycanilyticus]|uniref:Uncharacterized protein n=1 Tax=Paenibacillus glycanilyticus TaxID=126569 RepID=A0ABQ6GA96_9BACL|nr:hypothetical protein [Paenibacillus glycanilyticus]GLX67874.1 hypothetical protein MU1_22190 [Paenibacillus glycanilyticus]